MACDVITVRLHLAQIRVLEVVEDTPGALVVSVESTFRRLRCAQCGFKCHRVHDCDVSRHRKLVNLRGAGFFRVGFGVGSRGLGQGLGVGGVHRFGLRRL